MKKFDAAKYYREKYRNDPEYRKWRIQASNEWDKNHRDQVNERNRKRYAKRSSEQIKARKLYLKKLRGRKKGKKHLLKNHGVLNVKITITKIAKNEIQNPRTKIAIAGVILNHQNIFFILTKRG